MENLCTDTGKDSVKNISLILSSLSSDGYQIEIFFNS